MEIIEHNKAIAELMGATPKPYPKDGKASYYYDYQKVKTPTPTSSFWWGEWELQYHTSWDWLMPVVEKIESMQWIGVNKIYVQISDKSCSIWTYFDVKEFLRLTGDDKNEDGKYKVKITADTKIKATWLAIIDFIKWYNIHKQSK